MSTELKDQVQQLVSEILGRYNDAIRDGSGTGDSETRPTPATQTPGMFSDPGHAVQSATAAQRALIDLPLSVRKNIVAAMRQAALKNARLLAQIAVEETGLGNVVDKTAKNTLVAIETPGVEDLDSAAYTNEHGLSLVERAPYGVIGAIIPVTNPTSTVINNGIGMIAAGNAVVFNPHPSAKRASCEAVAILARAVVEAGGPKNLITAVGVPTIETATQLMNHPGIAILVVTGGPAVVEAAMGSGKKVIAAGPGNPPCVVDETADIARAGRDIVSGSGFDHNVVCICEKEVIVVESVADRLVAAMQANGAHRLTKEEVGRITDLVITTPGGPGVEGAPNKKYVGKSAATIAADIGLSVASETRVLLCEVDVDHPLVWTEQLMPVLPLVRRPTVDECIDLAFECEHGFRHTAMMHSLNVEKLSRMARLMNCSLFVKNGPCYAGLAKGGAGYTSFTIASPTGEGLTSARTFTRQRHCTLVDSFRIV